MLCPLKLLKNGPKDELKTYVLGVKYVTKRCAKDHITLTRLLDITGCNFVRIGVYVCVCI